MQLIAAITDGNTLFYLHDGRGSVVQVVNSLGGVLQHYIYSVFGELLNPVEDDMNPFRHNGEYFDMETGMYYLRARFFNPATGRFLTPDPYWHVGNMIFGSDGNNGMPSLSAIRQSANLYAFVSNNTIMFIDPLGLREEGIASFLTRHNPVFSITRPPVYPDAPNQRSIFWLNGRRED